MIINPLQLLLWTFRRNERDVIRLYDSLSDVMRLATAGSMLNFGYWDGDDSPVRAQERLCEIFGQVARLEAGQKIVDVGSGYGSPAAVWQNAYDPLEIACVNINQGQLRESSHDKFHLANATATSLPFGEESADRVLAFESAQHFRPLEDFVSESHRILKDDGLLALAIPVMAGGHSVPLVRLGLLSVTWSSEHYTRRRVESALRKKFQIEQCMEIGGRVYGPLADYYNANRDAIKKRLSEKYPDYVEKILFLSVNKMKAVSQDGIIDYLLVACSKQKRS